MIDFVELNILAILAAALANMLIGSMWYSPFLFGRWWLRLVHRYAPPVPDHKRAVVPAYGTMAIGSIITAFTLAYAFSFFEIESAVEAVLLSVLFWVGFVAAVTAHSVLFEGRSLGVYLIHLGYVLVSLSLWGLLWGCGCNAGRSVEFKYQRSK